MKSHRPGTLVLLLGFVAMPGLTLAAEAPKSAVGAPGQAGPAKFKKQEVEVTGVPQTQLTKPTPPPKEKKQSGPVISLEEFTGQRQDKIIKITDQQINQMQRLIRVTEDDDPQKPDFYFRLAELFAEKQKYNFFQARALDQKIFDAPPGQKETLKRQQAGYEKEQEKWLLQAVATYIEASKFRKFPRMDEVLFKLAYLLQTVKKEDQAREFFHRLIKDYPNSKYVPEAYLSFAEYFFQKGEMDNALKFYERVEQFPKSPVYGYAVYKKGWCWINLGDFKKALEIFVDVVRLAQSGRGGDKRQNSALEKEAKKDIVKAYARAPGATADKAWPFFQNTGGDYAPKMMESLGEIYWEQGMFTESTKTYRKIIAMNPQSPRICEWQNKVVRNTLSSGAKRDQVQEIGRLGLAFQHVGKLQNVKQDVMAECRNAFHDTSKELALVWHKEAQKTKNPDTYHLTKYLYKIYMDNFPREKGSIDMAFYYGEVLWVTESWKEAADQYTKVVEMDPKGKYVKEAAYAAVLSWKNYLNISDEGDRGENKGDDEQNKLKPKEIPEYQKKMVAAFDTYIKYVPDSPELVKIKYRKARIFYEYNHFPEAVKLFQDIVEKHTKDDLAIYSANLLLDSLNAQGRTREVIAWVDKFLGMQELMSKDPEFQKQMVSLKIDSMEIEGRRYEEEGNYKECGRSMLAAAESMPEHPKHAERLWNAGSCFQNARLIGQAIRAREELIKHHPKDPLALKAAYRIAAGYHQLASYTRAAEHYENFSTKFPGEKESVNALSNAYQFRLGLGDYDKALADIDAFVRFYGDRKPQQAADVYYQKSQVYEKQGRQDELIRHLNAYIKTWGNKGTPDKTIVAHYRLGEMAWKKSCPKEGINGACIEIKRVTATGRQKAIYDINKKIKDKRKKIRDVRTQCGAPTHSKITVIDRNKAVLKQAMEHFNTVLRLWRSDAKKIPQERMGFAQYAAAGAAFHQAEVVYEDFLRVKFPENLDFQAPSQYDSKRKAEAKKKKSTESIKRFNAYLDDKGKLATRLAGAGKDSKGMYNNVTEFKVAHFTVAATARLGQVWADFVNQLYTAEIPKELKEQDEWGLRPREIFCDALVDKAEPIEAKAVEGYTFCLKAATQESWFNEWSTLCEVELNQMQPSEYPLAAEAKPEPGYLSSLMTPGQVKGDLPSETTAVATSAQKE